MDIKSALISVLLLFLCSKTQIARGRDLEKPSLAVGKMVYSGKNGVTAADQRDACQGWWTIALGELISTIGVM